MREPADLTEHPTQRGAGESSAPRVVLAGSALEVVRWPLTEKVSVVLSERALTIERGPLLAVLRGGKRTKHVPIESIESVSFDAKRALVSLRGASLGTCTLHGPDAVRIGALLWCRGQQPQTVAADASRWFERPASLPTRPVDQRGSLSIGPHGIAFARQGLLHQVVGGPPKQWTLDQVIAAEVDAQRDIKIHFESGEVTFQLADASEVLQALRLHTAEILAARGATSADEEDARQQILGALATRSDINNDPVPPADLLAHDQCVFTSGNDRLDTGRVILQSNRVAFIPAASDQPLWQVDTDFLRRADLPDDPIPNMLLRMRALSQSAVIRPAGGADFVQAFWSAAAPFQYRSPSDEIDLALIRPAMGPVRFARVIPETLQESVFRPAFLVAADDGMRLMIASTDPWPYAQGAYLRLEISRPQGVFRLTAQFLREETDAATPQAALAHLAPPSAGTIHTFVLQPGLHPPELLRSKRSMLRLPTDEPVTLTLNPKQPTSPRQRSVQDTVSGRLADISAGGCAIQLRESIPEGSRVMVIPEQSNGHKFEAEVMQVRSMPISLRLSADLSCELGMRFTGLNEARLSWLQREVLKRQRDRMAIRAAAEHDDPDALPLLDRHYHA